MEKITTRLPFKDVLKIEKMAIKSGVSKSEVARRLIQKSLNSKETDIFNMLIELVITSRFNISDKDLTSIFTKIDEFKQQNGLK